MLMLLLTKSIIFSLYAQTISAYFLLAQVYLKPRPPELPRHCDIGMSRHCDMPMSQTREWRIWLIIFDFYDLILIFIIKICLLTYD